MHKYLALLGLLLLAACGSRNAQETLAGADAGAPGALTSGLRYDGAVVIVREVK